MNYVMPEYQFVVSHQVERRRRRMKAELGRIADELNVLLTDQEFASLMDLRDPCKELRNHFFYPKMKTLPGIDLCCVDPNEDSIYLCGHSLGLEPRRTQYFVQKELDKWAEIPTAKRHKILMEAKAFPSDHYVVESQIRFHGYTTDKAMICLKPREGEDCLREEDIGRKIEEEGEEIALVLFSGVQYYTGQLFDIPAITRVAQDKGCTVGFDLAHAVGNVPLRLSEWGVDFAAWCNYKYVNASAGGIAGVFIHSRHAKNSFPKFLGWWGHSMDTRFTMDNEMDLSPGPSGYRVSNPPPLLVCPLLASLEVFGKTSMEEVRKKSELLTGYLEFLIDHHFGEASPARKTGVHCRVLTPSETARRGAQLSLRFSSDLHSVFQELVKHGVACDKRMPNVIRIAPAPLYNSFMDVFRFCQVLEKILMMENKR